MMKAPSFPFATEQALRFASIAQPGPQTVLVFHVGPGVYGVPFSKVAEVRTLKEVLLLLNPPDYGTGSVTVHGVATVVIDLRVDFGVRAKFDDDTRLVICWRRERARDVRICVLVDNISDLMEIDGAEFEPTLDLGPRVGARFILATHGIGEQRMIILDPDYLIP